MSSTVISLLGDVLAKSATDNSHAAVPVAAVL